MDPDENWNQQLRLSLLESQNSHDRARLRELRAALNEWLRGGGFPPAAWGGSRVAPRPKKVGSYRVYTVPSRMHQGYDGIVLSLHGEVASQNGFSTPAAAMKSAAREARSIEKHGAMAARANRSNVRQHPRRLATGGRTTVGAHTRNRAASKYTTQSEVRIAIDRFEKLGIKAEERRDKSPYQLKKYWKEHDVAMKWFAKAEALMPARPGRRYATSASYPSSSNRAGQSPVKGNDMKGMKPSEKTDEKCLRRLRQAARDNPAIVDHYTKVLRGDYPQYK